MSSTRVSLAAFVFLSTGCGPSIVVYDVFQPDDDPKQDELHTYASHAQVPLRVRAASSFTTIADLTPKASGAIAIDTKTEVTTKDDVLSFAVLTGDAGTGTIEIVDKGGSVVAKPVTVDDADSLTLSVTAPNTEGVQLPAVDPGRVRIFAGRNAGFRATMKRGATEIVGLNAVTTSPADANATATNKTGFAEDTCNAARDAVDIAVPADAHETDVALSAGNAHLTVHVVPTVAADVTDLVLDQGKAVQNRGSVVAHVLAGTEPVFGAPVGWTIDNAALVDDKGNAELGDALQFDVPAVNQNPNLRPPTHTAHASLADQQAAVVVASTGNFNATSITADCASAPGSFAPVGALVVALLAWAKRKRPRP